MKAFPASGLSRLAKRVLAGEVVFFIGAGFSLDSEGNSAGCLIRRLLARFLAMTECLAEEDGPAAEEARSLVAGLKKTFALKKPETQATEGGGEVPALEEGVETLATEDNVSLLVREYYHINDWICTAFGILLDQLADLPAETRDRLLETVRVRERGLLKKLEDGAKPFETTGIPPEPIQFDFLTRLDAPHRGKALFLDTMGFADPAVMAAQPECAELQGAGTNSRGRLFPRHEVLARLAREGLCTTLLTTNYDLLIEGGYRLAGLNQLGRGTDGPLVPTEYEVFSPISSAEEFFRQGVGFRSALIVKIHGCVERYREYRERQGKGTDCTDWQDYLPAMVFTFREIQNWREDSWSRDYLCTLLRTRTLVFAGYSGMDPVLHDTFRTVYEEMARYRSRSGTAPEPVADPGAATAAPAPPPRARAFFFGQAGHQEFHSMEILRAASTAAGAGRVPLTEHPNYLPFRLRNKDEPQPFPTLDDLMRWLAHLVFRRRQWQALKTALRRTVVLLLGHPGAEADVRAVERRFQRLWREESRIARCWARRTSAEDEAEEIRDPFERVVGWTTRFHSSLLRELALADAVIRNQGPGFDIEARRRAPWYHPANDHPGWTAWGAILEIALRRLISS